MFVLQQVGPWWCPMCGAGTGFWGWGMMLFMWLFWVAVAVFVAWLILRVMRRGSGPWEPGPGDRAEAILRERYARGEIDRETYERMLEDLRR